MHNATARAHLPTSARMTSPPCLSVRGGRNECELFEYQGRRTRAAHTRCGVTVKCVHIATSATERSQDAFS
eukprot:4445505-Pleurochrysis_carterae.AAC.2